MAANLGEHLSSKGNKKDTGVRKSQEGLFDRWHLSRGVKKGLGK